MHGTDLLKRGARVLLGALAVAAVAGEARAQVTVCDLDIHDDVGDLVWGNTIHLNGRVGAGTNIGRFVISNGNSPETDYDRDGYSGTCDFTALYVRSRTPLVSVDNPALAIPPENIIVTRLPRRLPNGTQALVDVNVILPPGTLAGTYLGRITIEDSLYGVRNTPTNEVWARDYIQIEVVVAEDRGVAIVDDDSARALDSLVLRGRAGQRTSGVLRIANAGNASLDDLRLSASDLRSESAVGLVIPAENITFSPPSFSGLAVSDTQRVVVTVQIPRGILGGRYRGSITVQGGDTPTQTIPLIVIVTSTRGILFTNNPARGLDGVAQMAFNGDPGQPWKLAIFDMTGRLVFETSGSVFAGVGGSTGSPGAGSDFAQSVIWSLTNGLGEPVASGMYLVVVESIVEGRRSLAKDKLMVIR